MAIYGLNFTETPIPAGVKRHFPARLKLPGMARGEYALLQGIGQSERDRDAMLVQATNGSRRLHVEARQTAAGVWFGIYTHYSDAVPSIRLDRAALTRQRARIAAEQAGLDDDTADAVAAAVSARLRDTWPGNYDAVLADEIQKHANP